MAVTFPTSPTNGQQLVVDGKTYTYSSAQGVWNITGGTQTSEFVYTRQEFVATANQTTFNVLYSTDYPIEVFVNGLQYLSTDYTATNGTTVVLDTGVPAGSEVVINYATATSEQFNPGAVSTSIIPDTNEAYDLGSATNKFRDLYLSGNTLVLGDTSISASDGELSITSPSNPTPAPLGGGANIYATVADLPLSGVSAGAFAHVTETNTLYMNNGSGWYKIALINTAPSITSGGAGAYTLATDGTPTVITLTAEDPEGIPITWSYSVTSGSLGTTATVSQADNEFTITPSTQEADAGTFELTFTASDGVNIATDISSFTLQFANYDLSTYSLTSSREVATAYSISREGSVWVDPAGNYFAAVGRTDLTVRIFNSTNGEIASGSQWRTFGISGTTSYPGGIFIHPDGSKLWIFDGGGSENLYSWDLSTSFDVSTASNLSTVTLNDISAASYGGTFAFSSDGSYMWSDGGGTVGITSWSLSTPYDPSSRTVITNSYITTSLEWGSNQAHMSTFSPDGTHWIVYGGDANNANAKSIFAYSLSTPYDPSTASTLVGKTTVNNQGGGYNNNGIHFVNDGVTFFDRNFGHYRQYQAES